jgi:hypothetical protein
MAFGLFPDAVQSLVGGNRFLLPLGAAKRVAPFVERLAAQ